MTRLAENRALQNQNDIVIVFREMTAPRYTISSCTQKKSYRKTVQRGVKHAVTHRLIYMQDIPSRWIPLVHVTPHYVAPPTLQHEYAASTIVSHITRHAPSCPKKTTRSSNPPHQRPLEKRPARVHLSERSRKEAVLRHGVKQAGLGHERYQHHQREGGELSDSGYLMQEVEGVLMLKFIT